MPIRLTGLSSGLDTESIISALVSSYSYKTDKYKKAQTKLSWKQDAWKSLNTKVYSLYTSLDSMRFSKNYNMKSTSVSDSTKAKVTASNNAPNGTQKLNILQIAQAGYLTGAKLDSDVTKKTTMEQLGYTNDEGKINLEMGDGTTKSIAVSKSTTVDEFLTELQDAGLNANYDTTNQRFYISSSDTGKDKDFTLTGTDAAGKSALSKLGLDISATTDAYKVNGQNAIITLNGIQYEGSTNAFTINGLNIEAQAVTGSGDSNAVLITTKTDTQGVYDKVKEFFTQYNSLINELTSLYNADSAKGYEPLTDDEKDSMSDSEVEKWEEKIKGSLLRRDDTLSGLISAMTTSMSKTYEINGKSYSLSSFGISTQGYLTSVKNQQNSYHIDGDEDDSVSSGNTDKLMSALASDPDSVISFMQQLTSGLYTAIGDKMKSSTTVSSAYTVYNDKEMASEYSDYTDTIKKWEDKLSDKQEYYYKKFSSMESALSKLNSQTSSLTNLFG